MRADPRLLPGTGLCSIINKMADGGGIEVACIGNEGVVGINAQTGDAPVERNGFVQVADGTVEYMPVVFFERELARNGRFREVVDRFCHSFVGTVIQAVACNRLHTTDERCSRWLLSVHERLGRGRFELKVRFLARAQSPTHGAVRGCVHAVRLVDRHEIASAVQRTHTLRKYRAQLLADRAQLYRNILKRSSGRT